MYAFVRVADPHERVLVHLLLFHAEIDPVLKRVLPLFEKTKVFPPTVEIAPNLSPRRLRLANVRNELEVLGILGSMNRSQSNLMKLRTQNAHEVGGIDSLELGEVTSGDEDWTDKVRDALKSG